MTLLAHHGRVLQATIQIKKALLPSPIFLFAPCRHHTEYRKPKRHTPMILCFHQTLVSWAIHAASPHLGNSPADMFTILGVHTVHEMTSSVCAPFVFYSDGSITLKWNFTHKYDFVFYDTSPPLKLWTRWQRRSRTTKNNTGLEEGQHMRVISTSVWQL